jgi:hypothetical protein
MDKDTSLSTSPQLEVREQNGVVVALSQKQIISLFKKSEASGIPFDTLKEVYERGFTSELSEQAAFGRVNSFIAGGAAAKMDKDLIEKRGLWDNIHAKRERIKHGSGEKMRKPGSKGAPTAQAFKDAAEEVQLEGKWPYPKEIKGKATDDDSYLGTGDRKRTARKAIRQAVKAKAHKELMTGKSANEEYTGAEKTTSDMTKPASRFVGTTELTNTYKDMTPGQSVKDTIKRVVKEQLEEAATDDAKGYKSSTGGLTQKGRDHYNRTTGSNLKAPVTTKPSKLKPGSKAANRRKSFCARMGGMKKRLTGSETANDPDSRINKALRKWNC